MAAILFPKCPEVASSPSRRLETSDESKNPCLQYLLRKKVKWSLDFYSIGFLFATGGVAPCWPAERKGKKFKTLNALALQSQLTSAYE